MRIHILSDLHLEFGPFHPAEVDADVVVAAGDVRPGSQGVAWLLEAFPGKPVLYVPGNHEFYGHAYPKLLGSLRESAEGTRVRLLECDQVEIEGWVFLGATLWTDFELDGDCLRAQAAAAAGMNDFRRIRVSPVYRRLKPRDVRGIHLQTVQWLREAFVAHRGRRVVVITHHAPSRQSLDLERTEAALAPAYASDLEELVADSGAVLWIYGHTHRRMDFVVGRTRVISNPRGYEDEPVAGFDPALVVEV